MLEIRRLTKCYAGIPAVNQVSFTVRPYEVCGYLGPNGSGKTTTVNMLTGLLEPTAGEILFHGQNIRNDLIGYKKQLGYVPEEAHLYPFLTGLEYLELVGRLRSIPRKTLDRKCDAFLQLFSLHEDRHSPISSYSKGMKQKLMISAALLHDPELVIFDEPLSGLDVTSALIFRSVVRRLAEQGKTILYSSHVLEVVEKVCTSVVILRKGEAVANDSVERLRDLMSLPSLEDIFSQLVLHVDTEQVAGDIVDAMRN